MSSSPGIKGESEMRDLTVQGPGKKLPMLALLLLAFMFFGCSSHEATRETESTVSKPTASAIQTQTRSTYVIRKGDQIQLSVWGYPEFAVSTQVKETGTIAIPLVGEVIAAGLTQDQFFELMRQRLSEYVKGEVRLTINVVSATSQKITVFGAVARPQGYPVTGEVSLLDILTTAGGLSSESDLQNVRIWHANENNRAEEVNLSSYLESGNIDEMPMLYPGDTVFVPRRENFVREVAEYLRDLIYVFGFFGVFR
jgi:polysaccharide export outer membrane protein